MTLAVEAPTVTGYLTEVDGVEYYRIDGVESMDPFLMTVVSSTDLWMFVSSTGALTAGRVDADHSIFPYETDDRLHRAAGITGPVTVVARMVDGQRHVWRPFGTSCDPECSRSVAKSTLGDRLVFEETHRGWDLTFRVTWAPTSTYGWVRTAELVDRSGAGADVEVLDGLLDVMPSGIDAVTEQLRSNLADAYKRSETGRWGTAAIYSLESLITDRAEPAEALLATVVWSYGFPVADADLEERSVHAMVAGRPSDTESLLKGRRGAYLLRGPITVPGAGSITWSIVADTALDHAAVQDRLQAAMASDAPQLVAADIAQGTRRLHDLLAGADAFQTTADGVADAHHLSNVLFNSMRGGVFPHGYDVPVADFLDFLHVRNRVVLDHHGPAVKSLEPHTDVGTLLELATDSGDVDFMRLVLEYLPLTFSRRHGDPSRPWNRFSIEVLNDDGSEALSYQGNWRDIFQNWEALLHSFPSFFPHVVAKFVNASTVDGHNPYRISRDGIDWEAPDPHDPWANIGYWGDHQIIYLLRLLEAWNHFAPDGISSWLDKPVFVYADVPYEIADHQAMLADPRNTISYDTARAAETASREEVLGSDGRLVVDAKGALVRVGLLEKLIVPALGKLTSYVPHGGIWLNTQRPEWNDANNALAGYGLSMVTLYHLARYLRFLRSLVEGIEDGAVRLTQPVAEWLTGLLRVLEAEPPSADAADDAFRRTMLDALGSVGSTYRARVWRGFDQTPVEVPVSDLLRLCDVAHDHLAASIRSGRRDDGLYHSYNLVSFSDGAAAVRHLGQMLEGQVAVLSSGELDAVASAEVIDALFASDMYREDQNSFMLYPVRTLPPFIERNQVPEDSLTRFPTLAAEVDRLSAVFARGPSGRLHFHADLVNPEALERTLDGLDLNGELRSAIETVYEEIFDHHAFTGRSSAMYGYEGIGSVYWHMVAKLLLATQEAYWSAVDAGEADALVERLAAAYRRIRSGLGFQKDPATFGAIPTDCYSHTPAHAGAQQPGMTGQVKEEILTRFGELGLRVIGGRIWVGPRLLESEELFLDSEPVSFTFCEVPMTVAQGEGDSVEVVYGDGRHEQRPGWGLTESESSEVFGRTGRIVRVDFTVGRKGSNQ